MPRRLNRIQPALPVGAYKTYQILAPRDTHFRRVSCEEYACANYANGWKSVINEATDLGRQQAQYIRFYSRLKFTEERQADLTVFVFRSGQQCFEQHRERIDKPEIFVVRGGDWRGNPTGQVRRHVKSSDWVEDFAEHQDRIKTQIEKG